MANCSSSSKLCGFKAWMLTLSSSHNQIEIWCPSKTFWPTWVFASGHCIDGRPSGDLKSGWQGISLHYSSKCPHHFLFSGCNAPKLALRSHHQLSLPLPNNCLVFQNSSVLSFKQKLRQTWVWLWCGSNVFFSDNDRAADCQWKALQTSPEVAHSVTVIMAEVLTWASLPLFFLGCKSIFLLFGMLKWILNPRLTRLLPSKLHQIGSFVVIILFF